MDTMSMKIEQTNIDELIPYASNSRTHSEEQVAQIAASIKEFGFNNPVLLDGDNGIIAGHGRTLAARKLGLKVVPTIELAHLSDSQRKAYIIADNKLALNAGWDMPLLEFSLHELSQDNFDLSLTGFNDLEINNIIDPVEGEFNAEDEWNGMPSFTQGDVTAFKSITVHFENQNNVDEFMALINQDITPKTKMIWHPKLKRENLKAQEYRSEN